MQISYDRQLPEISAYRNRILLFQVSMMLRKTQLDLYIITGEFSSNSARVCIRVNNTVNFRSRDRLTPKSIVGSISASTSCRVVLPPSRSDPPSTFNKKKKKHLIFQYLAIFWYTRFVTRLPTTIERFDKVSTEEWGVDATIGRRQSYLHSCKMHPRTGRGNAIHGDLCVYVVVTRAAFHQR